jgi:hypothetical protein
LKGLVPSLGRAVTSGSSISRGGARAGVGAREVGEGNLADALPLDSTGLALGIEDRLLGGGTYGSEAAELGREWEAAEEATLGALGGGECTDLFEATLDGLLDPVPFIGRGTRGEDVRGMYCVPLTWVDKWAVEVVEVGGGGIAFGG